MHNANNLQDASGLIARKPKEIMRIFARNIQFGYKDGLSTIDEIVKIEHHIDHADARAGILLINTPHSIGAVNGTLLRPTL